MKKTFLLIPLLLIFLTPLSSQNKNSLAITEDDFYVTSDDVKGWHLFVNKKSGIESILLVESAQDPDGKITNYAYRTLEYNPVNGDEIRCLNGKVLKDQGAKYPLIDSTPEKNEKFGQSFHIYIPKTIVYGYEWSRHKTIQVENELFVNIRTFSKKYADYTGKFQDNAFTISLNNKTDIDYKTEDLNFEAEKEIIETESEEKNSENTWENSENYEVEIQNQNNDDDFSENYDLGEDYNPEDAYIVDLPEYDDFIANLSNQKEKKGTDDTDVPGDPFVENWAGVDKEALQNLLKNLNENPSQTSSTTKKEKKLTIEELEALHFNNIADANPLKNYDGVEFSYVMGRGKIPDLYISTTEITQKVYRRVMGENPSAFIGEDLPVDSVTWYEALVFCNILSIREGKEPCYSINGETLPKKWGKIPVSKNTAWDNAACNTKATGYRLLTPEEWTYAASGGAIKDNYDYSGSNNIEDVAWYFYNSEGKTHSVAGKMQNSSGLYDMTGNVSELLYGKSGDKTKTVPVRGGNYFTEDKDCLIKSKEAVEPWLSDAMYGFRICRGRQ